jgi:peptide/nickel transport system permease protein
VVVLVAATLTFALLHAAPGDAGSALGEGVDPGARAALRARAGLGRPVWLQYLHWLGGMLRGDLGWSTWQQRPVAAMLADALPHTLLLVGSALVVSLGAGIALGRWQGARVGTRGDRVVGTALLVAYALPEFWVALALLAVLVHAWGWLPAGGAASELAAYLPPGERWLDRARHLLLPVLSLAIVTVAVVARVQRSAMREALAHPSTRTARALGLPERRVRQRAWRAALLPVLTLAGLYLPALATGAVFVERIFAWPGMGRLLLGGIDARDPALVAGVVVLASAITALGAVLTDVARWLADPRLRGR